jgi:hypothetical protein
MSQHVMEVVAYSYDEETKKGIVTAMVDDFIVRYPATYEFPAEYGPALVEANFVLEDEEQLPEDTTELEMFFEDLDLEWRVVDTSDYDCDD